MGTVRKVCRLLNWCLNLPLGLLWGRDAGCLSCVGTYLWGTLGRCTGCLNGVGTYISGTDGIGAGSLSSVATNLLGTVVQGCRLFKGCQNLPTSHCGSGVRAVKAVSEPTSRALWVRGAGCLKGDRTYLPGNVGQGCRLFKLFQNLPPGHCGAGVQAVLVVSEFRGAGVQADSSVSKTTSGSLWGRGAGCLRGVRTTSGALW